MLPVGRKGACWGLWGLGAVGLQGLFLGSCTPVPLSPPELACLPGTFLRPGAQPQLWSRSLAARWPFALQDQWHQP